MKHTLFSNYHCEIDQNGKDDYDYAKEYLFADYGEKNGWKSVNDVPDQEAFHEVALTDELDWAELEYTFGKFLTDSRNGFLLVGHVGRWNGTVEGGCYVNSFNDLYKFWKDCDYVKIYDKKGHLYIEATHHDGTNYAELKELTDKGSDYRDNHRWDSDREVHEKLFNSNFYTRLPHYAHKVWGCKKGA